MRIALITSGGDSPGMNPCAAELVIRGCARGHEMLYFSMGFCGIRDNDIKPLCPTDVYGWHRRGGSFLRAGRLHALAEPEMRDRLARVLRQNTIDALVVLGGDGSFQGALALSEAAPEIAFVGIPCTIDNNVFGTDYTLGYDTAMNKLAHYIDDITDTGESMYPRVFFVETLGGPDSYFARTPVEMGISDFCITHDSPLTGPETAARIRGLLDRHEKPYVIVTVSENINGIGEIIADVDALLGIQTKYNVIGYQQRGGAPTAIDRLHAAHFAQLALILLEQGEKHRYLVYADGRYSCLDLACANRRKHPPEELCFEVQYDRI